MGCCGGRKIVGDAGRAMAVPPRGQPQAAPTTDGGRELLRRAPVATPKTSKEKPAAAPRPATGRILPERGRARAELLRGQAR